MKTVKRLIIRPASVLLCGILSLAIHARAADFNIQTPGFYYSVNGGSDQNPVITLVRGATYTFQIDAESDHPFFITPSDGVENNNIFSGVITFHVPADAQSDAIMYLCSIHGFGNSFEFVDPAPQPAPPPLRIVNFLLGTNLVLRSTGTNNLTLIPEYSTNLFSTNWFALSVQTNRFNGGTNETICGRPPGNDIFIRIRVPSTP